MSVEELVRVQAVLRGVDVNLDDGAHALVESILCGQAFDLGQRINIEEERPDATDEYVWGIYQGAWGTLVNIAESLGLEL